MNWAYVVMKILYEIRISYLKLVGYLVLKPKIAMRYPINIGIWRMKKWKEENYEIQADLQSTSRKKYHLICPDSANFHGHNYVQGTKVYQSLIENLTNITFLGRKETSFTSENIISK